MTQWTDDRVALLTRLWNEEMPASAIADRLGGGLGRNAVIGKARRLGLPGRINPTADEEMRFQRGIDLIVDAPLHVPAPIHRVARVVGMTHERFQEMWDQRIEATHGGDPL